MKKLVSEDNVEVLRTFHDLSRRLRRLSDYSSIAVLVARTKEDLLDIISLHSLLRYTRIILILPDEEDATISIGHRLRPRFMTFYDSDFSNIIGVLSKMFQKDDFKCSC